MRQAGRYIPEYRAIREKVSMLDAIRTPDIACQITLQPINAFNLDAAILFADILTPLIGMGIDLDFVKGEGPCINNPIRTEQDVACLRTPPALEALPYTIETVHQLVAELTPRNIPLIGFAGAPFTMASYAIEGGGSKNYERTKGLMWSDPLTWDQLMTKLVVVISDYLVQQAVAGASALQIFDSWAGALSPRDYTKYVASYTRQVIENAQKSGVPVIYFSTGTGTMLEQIAALGSDVVSVDWRIALDRAWDQIGTDRAIQGNLDPVLLFAPWDEIQANVDDILRQASHRPGHIFNLGHGILPETPVDTVRRLADYVHEKTAEQIGQS
jgi:uroporphyrinogen decarboxylase